MHIAQLMVTGGISVGCAFAFTACAGSASYNPEAATNPSGNSPLRLSDCMHSHGIKDFPDPTGGSGGPGLSLETSPGSASVIADGILFSGPAFDAAAKACAKLLPGGGAPPPPPTARQKQQALEFAECMRRHGVSNYPDPTFSTGGDTAGPRAGVNPFSPVFKRAAAACGAGHGKTLSIG